MEFVHPYWLFGLLAVAVPVIIHLFNFRRYRKIYFTNLSFLKNIKKESKKRRDLRQLLVLLCRILAITFLVLAFARPYIPNPEGIEQGPGNHLSFYVDNSLSMQAIVNGHSLLDEAKLAVNELAMTFDAADRYQLITNDFEGRHQPFYSRDEFLRLLAGIELTPVVRILPEVSERYRETLPETAAERASLFVISDFQRSSALPDAFRYENAGRTFLFPLSYPPVGNVYIDTCWFETPFNHLGQQQVLHAGFRNESEIDLEKIPVRLMIEGEQRALANLNIAAGGKASTALPFINRKAGNVSAFVYIDDYPVTWDDRMYISWQVKETIPVLAISDDMPGPYFNSLFSNDSVFRYSQAQYKKLDYQQFRKADLVVLDRMQSLSTGLAASLNDFIHSGGSLLIIPAPDADIMSINRFLSELNPMRLLSYDTLRLSVTGIDTEHEIFDDVFEKVPENIDLPFVRGHYRLEAYRNSRATVIMDLQNGDPLLIMARHGKGRLYLLMTPASEEYGNLVKHALWVPLIYRMAMLSRPQQELYYTIGNDMSISFDREALLLGQPPALRHAEADIEFIPGLERYGQSARLFFYDQLKLAGHYELLHAGEKLAGLSFNYDRQESDPSFYSIQEIRDLIVESANTRLFLLDSGGGKASEAFEEFGSGREYWKIFIWLALAFLLIEILLLRLFPD
jgi:hypothetical protein